MKHFRVPLAAVFTVMMVVVAFAVMPTTNGLCPLSVNAQDNPCLEQAATISAMQVALIQSTLDTMNHQATVTAYESALAAQSSGTITTSGTSGVAFVGTEYTETFDDNSRGWALFSLERHNARISQGQLLLYGDRMFTHIPVPNADPERFFVEANASTRDGNAYIGFALTNGETTYYLVLYPNGARGNFMLRQNTTDLYGTGYNNILNTDSANTIALEARNGLYSFYVNGQLLETVNVERYGYPVSLSGGHGTAVYDNVTVRADR